MLPGRAGVADERLLQKFIIAPRMTAHVRHRGKYFDVPLPENEAFVFTCQGRPVGPPARTLNEFARLQNKVPPSSVEGHAERGDFSRWIAGVFGDRSLADEIAEVEEKYRKGKLGNLPLVLADCIRHRYVSPSVS